MEAKNTTSCQNIVLTFKGLKEEFKQGVKDFWWCWLAPQRIINDYNTTFKWPEGGPSIPKYVWVTKPTTYTNKCYDDMQVMSGIVFKIAVFRVRRLSEYRYSLDPTPYIRVVRHNTGRSYVAWASSSENLMDNNLRWEGVRSNNVCSEVNRAINYALYDGYTENGSPCWVSPLIQDVYKNIIWGIEDSLEF